MYVCLWLAGFAYIWRLQRGVQSSNTRAAIHQFSVLPGRKLLHEGNWTPGLGRRTGLDTPAVQSSIKMKETLKLRGNVFEGFVRDSV